MSRLGGRQVVGTAAAVAACAVCCEAPVVGLLGVAGLAATAVTLAFAGVVFAAVVGLITVAAVLVPRRRHQQGCEPPSAGTVSVELGPLRSEQGG